MGENEDNVLGKTIAIEDRNGDVIMAIHIDKQGKIEKFAECDIADIETDFIFENSEFMKGELLNWKILI